MIFSLLDTKAELFASLFESETADSAKRLFVSLLLSGTDNSITQFPHDYSTLRLSKTFKTKSITFSTINKTLNIADIVVWIDMRSITFHRTCSTIYAILFSNLNSFKTRHN